jgi:hypothetical protein
MKITLGTGGTVGIGSLIRRAFAPDATIKLCGCETAYGGKSSIAGGFKTLLPQARVYGHTGAAWRYSGSVTGPYWYGIGGSRFVEVK